MSCSLGLDVLRLFCVEAGVAGGKVQRGGERQPHAGEEKGRSPERELRKRDVDIDGGERVSIWAVLLARSLCLPPVLF